MLKCCPRPHRVLAHGFSIGCRVEEASKPGSRAGFRIKTPVSGRNFAGQRNTRILQRVPKSLFVSKCYGWAIRLRAGRASLSPHSLAQHSPHLRSSRGSSIPCTARADPGLDCRLASTTAQASMTGAPRLVKPLIGRRAPRHTCIMPVQPDSLR